MTLKCVKALRVAAIAAVVLTVAGVAWNYEAYGKEHKTTLAISEIAEGAYAGTLSGCSYSNAEDKKDYIISQDISPAEITVTIKDGQVELYCKADAIASGSVLGVEAPRSPSYTRIASGKLPLSQTDASTVRAKGDVASSGKSPYINWGRNKKFTRWDIKPMKKDSTYYCTVSIAMTDGVPTAQIKVDGSEQRKPSRSHGGAPA